MPTLPASLPVLTVMAIVPLAGALLLWLVPPLRRLHARAWASCSPWPFSPWACGR